MTKPHLITFLQARVKELEHTRTQTEAVERLESAIGAIEDLVPAWRFEGREGTGDAITIKNETI